MSRFQYPSIPTLPEQAGTKFSEPEPEPVPVPEPEPANRIAWRDIPINRLTREQMIACIEALDRNVQACRAERDDYLSRWKAAEQALDATIKECNRVMDEWQS